ncbi:iron-binding CDGSH zinc finger protein [Stella humosa]|uniref:Iron-binding CDGSH zinc finger protein n=1 Tax=Stella humosa TaxID=94 RepID=A0A3N1L825_9PROT|nr:CDGSH iron-sulfur domain-containing protein [Stella humosa]ROP90823.1 iron-binding CDGSH zinc finger protein [Stella humosa]BBK34831.1 hypothetical protein STHU_54650 [Stella humosa]
MTDPVPAQLAPYNVKVRAGRKYFWCACGRSRQQPFCDGSHGGTGITAMQWTAAADGEIWFCGCKRTANAPLCDGSHERA